MNGPEMGGNDGEEHGQKGAKESFSDSNLIKNSKGNLITADSDDNLKEVFRQIKTSKTPTVINYGASW
ncbi:hypothetical protein CDL12_28281 [Handroanthus impetiginosus]|uniref:Uncharacterized protein n=1 Tax=Handroanthus impetiginosus TaxID=429701 RepID=A0A2G9G1P4_9LAMI|nr:hypothetical protein CDL12_28281 [Handroanthus impetiginosus]